MTTLRAWCVRLLGLFAGRRREREFAEELESHLQMHIDDNLRAGMSPQQARRQALIRLGGVQPTREAYRDRAGVPALETLTQDIRFAVRMLRKAPGFTTIAVLVLALGIGANAAMFSLVNALLFRPLNGGAGHGTLVGLYTQEHARPDSFRPFSYPEYVDIRARNGVFADVFIESVAFLGLTDARGTKQATVSIVSSSYFSTLGAVMAAGRDFTIDEDAPGRRTAVVIVSHPYWKQLGLDPSVIGREIHLNGEPFTIVGVAPEGFNGTMPILAADAFVPLGSAELVSERGSPLRRLNDRSAYALLVSGVLKPGIATGEAEPLLAPLAAELARVDPERNRDRRLFVHPLSRLSRGPSPRSDTSATAGAAIFMLMSALVLLVACLNLANMLLAKGGTRKQEIAIRLALGGGRARIIRQLLTEGLLLSAMGGAAAIVLARGVGDVLVSSLARVVPMTVAIDTSIDIRVAMITIAASVASALVFSLGPAWKLSRPDVMSRIKQSAPESAGPGFRRRFTLPNVLVAGQIALSLALTVTAGLFIRAGAKAAVSDPGFSLEGGLMAQLNPALIGHDEPKGRALFEEVLGRVRAMPNVEAASLASIVPFGNTVQSRLVDRAGASSPQTHTPSAGHARDDGARATFTSVGADYFAALGLSLVAGREFTPFEERSSTATPVAIIDQVMAQRLFPGENPLGQSVRFRLSQEPTQGESVQIVGIVPSVRDDILQPTPEPHLYVPFGRNYFSDMTLHVRVGGGAPVTGAVLGAVRREIQSVDSLLPIVSLTSMSAHRDRSPSLWAIGIAAKLLAAFGGIALFLATVGVYGLRAYLVAERTREFGIRMALGATPGSVVRQIMGEGVAVTTVGLVIGLVVGFGLSRLLAGILYEVGGSFEPIVLISAPILLAAAAAAASYVPARRALRLDPLVALRQE